MERKSFTRNAIVCVLAAIVIGGVLVRLANRFFYYGVPPIVMAGTMLLMLVSSVVFSIIWYLKERKGSIDSHKTLAWVEALLKYGLALQLCLVGWEKILHLQFIVPIGKLDHPFSSLSRTDLLWAFFGQSYPFILVIGFIQILGGVMLLFSKTRLIGVFILIPVLLNIILLDIFYEIESGPLGLAVTLLFGVLYFLLIEYDRLKTFFFHSGNTLTVISFKSNVFRSAVRLLVVIVPMIVILTNKRLAPFVYEKTQLPAGRYEVKQLTMNDKPIDVKDCRDSVVTKVYIEHDMLFQYQDIDKRLYGEYKFDEQTKQLRATWHFPRGRNADLEATVTQKGDALIFEGVMGASKIRMELQKAAPPKAP